MPLKYNLQKKPNFSSAFSPAQSRPLDVFFVLCCYQQLKQQTETLGKTENKILNPLLHEINFTYLELHYYYIFVFQLDYELLDKRTN